MWNYKTRVSSLVFHNNCIISTADTVYEIYVGTFFICKYAKHFDHLTMLHHTTATVQYKQDLDQVSAVPACSTSA